jgi:hypothetical protein
MNPAFLAKLTVHGLTRSAQSSDLTETLAAREGMSTHAIAVSQTLLPMQDLKDAGITSVAELFNVQGQLSKLHRENTLPWSNDGWRILPTLAYEKYNDKAHALIARLHQLRHTVATEWDSRILPVCRQAHSHRYRPELYPSAVGILQRVDATLAYMPLSTDFRTEIIGAEIAAQLSAQANDRLSRAVADSNKQVASALLEMLAALVATLENPKGKLYDSIFENLRGFLDRMPALNLNNDPSIAEFRQAVAGSIGRLSPAQIRATPAIRSHAAALTSATVTTFARRLHLTHLDPKQNQPAPPVSITPIPTRRLVPQPKPEAEAVPA